MLIYRVTNLVNGMSYIGKTARSMKVRRKEHTYDVSRTNFYFHRALRKYGKDSFEWEIIKRCNSHDELIHSEQFFIKQFNTKVPDGYNMTDGGEGMPNPTEETKRKLREFNLGKTLTKEHVEKIAERNRGQKRSEQARRNISEAHKGYKWPEERKEARRGKRVSIKTEFKKGIIPWNKGLKGCKGGFKIGHTPWNKGKTIRKEIYA